MSLRKRKDIFSHDRNDHIFPQRKNMHATSSVALKIMHLHHSGARADHTSISQIIQLVLG